MTSTGIRRTFVSPNLEHGRAYAYTLRAEFIRNGKAEVLTRDVVVCAGEETVVDMKSPAIAGAILKSCG
jgi:uncharacterized protein (TIGR03000 family)